MVEAARRLRQPVAPPQTRPAILAVHELVAEAEVQLRVRAQAGNTPQAQTFRLRLAQAERVRVVKAQ